LIIWEGTLTDGTDALAISPGVWEDDLNALAFSGYVKAQFAAQGPLWQNAQILAPRPFLRSDALRSGAI
jgi:hypothetical protein